MIFIATILVLLVFICIMSYVHLTLISSWFVMLPSDNAGVSVDKRYEQIWIRKYLPKTATVLQIEGTRGTAINVQTMLENPLNHLLLHTNLDLIDNMPEKIYKIHGTLAMSGTPVTFISRGYAVTDYNGVKQENVEGWQQYTMKQLNTLYGLMINAMIFECDTCSDDIILDMIQTGELRNMEFILIRRKTMTPEFEHMMQQNMLKKVEHYGGSSIWIRDREQKDIRV